MKGETVILIKVKSCNALLLMLLLWIRSYLNSVLRYKFLNLDVCHLDIIRVCMYVSKDVRIRGYFAKPKGTREQEGLGNTGL
jgi:hypothetical protein